MLISSSADGITWNNPVAVSTVEVGGYYDKPWIGCDNTPTSKFYGNCYVEWDDFAQFDLIEMSTSHDGGKTWSFKKTTAASDSGNGGIPLVQPNGTVIVTIDDPFPVERAGVQVHEWRQYLVLGGDCRRDNEHGVGGNMRALPLIASQMDAAGTVYVAWADCSFRTNCSSNDIVYSTSSNGTTWTSPKRVPIDATTSTVDHFTPGFAIQKGTSGSTAHIGLTYYFFPNADCGSVCNLSVGYVASTNGGATWSAAKTLAKGMNPSWLPSTTSGQMVGDFMATSFVDTKAHGVFATAKTPVGTTFNEAMETNQFGLAVVSPDEPQFSSANDKPVPHAHSDVPRRTTPHRDDQR